MHLLTSVGDTGPDLSSGGTESSRAIKKGMWIYVKANLTFYALIIPLNSRERYQDISHCSASGQEWVHMHTCYCKF